MRIEVIAKQEVTSQDAAVDETKNLKLELQPSFDVDCVESDYVEVGLRGEG